MPDTFLFCTTDVSGELLAEFFDHSGNKFWFLIRDQQDPPVGKIEESSPKADFEQDKPVAGVKTSFPDFSVDEIGKIFRERYNAEYGSPREGMTRCDPNSFGIIDQRGAQEKTILVVTEFFLQPEGEAREDDMTEGWRTLRVPFFAASRTAFGIEESKFLFFDEVMAEPGDGLTEEGIFVFPGDEEEYEKHGWKVKKT